MSTKRGSQGKRYTNEQKAKILTTAKKEKLTGAQVRERFGVSTLSFYRWRGPVKGRKKRGRPMGSKNKVAGRVRVNTSAIRREVQAQIKKLLPQIIRDEVKAALKG